MTHNHKEERELEERLFFTLIGLLLFAIGIFTLVATFLPIIMLPLIGTSTQGIVENLVESEYHEGVGINVDDSVSKYHVHYSFKLPSGEVVAGHAQLSRKSWTSLELNQSVRVLYLPNYPRINIIADFSQSFTSNSERVIVPFMFGVVGFFMLFGVPPKIKKWLNCHGIV